MLMNKERRTAIRTVRGWAIAVLQEAGAIRECEYHGWMQDRADPHARERAFEIARQYPPAGLSPAAATGAVTEVLELDRRCLPRMPTRGLGNALTRAMTSARDASRRAYGCCRPSLQLS